MEYLLIDCCVKIIDLLNTLRENGSITQEEFDEHIKIKQHFINECILPKIYIRNA
jgi:hypothetical protein